MKYLHTMVRVTDVAKSLRFYCDALGLKEVRRYESQEGRFTLIYLAALTDIDPTLYEAAVVDGASRWQQSLRRFVWPVRRGSKHPAAWLNVRKQKPPNLQPLEFPRREFSRGPVAPA